MSNGRSAIDLLVSGEPLLHPTVGTGVYTSRLVAGLVRKGMANFRVLLDSSLREKVSDLPEEFLLFLPSSRLPHPILRQLQRAKRAADFAIGNYPDAVFHSPAPFWCSRRPRKTVVTLHDCIQRHFPKYLGRNPLRRWLAFAAERFAAASEMVLTVSNYSAADLADNARIPKEKLRVIHNWVGSEYCRSVIQGSDVELVRRKLELPARYWLYVGGYDYRKNVELLVEAYAAASKLANCPPLVLAGKIPARTKRPYADILGAVRRSGVTSNFVLTGKIAAADMPGLYAAADLLVFPSLYEGFGLPVIEAIAAGTPVLVSDATSLPEIVPSSECRFDPRSPAALRDKLIEAAGNPQKFKCALDERFTETYAINEYLGLIRSLGRTVSTNRG